MNEFIILADLAGVPGKERDPNKVRKSGDFGAQNG
jgi:hypothetical protein